MKAVMISIRPEWTRLILSGKKTLEVRKTRPKMQPPFKCYIYQTLPKSGDWNERDGRVIGEFICSEIVTVWPGYKEGDDCLTFEQQEKYLGSTGYGYGWRISELKVYNKPKKLSEFYRWWEGGDDIRPCQNGKPCVHIIYDYSENCEACGIDFDGTACPYLKVQRPPQSWCYVEELEDWK